MDTIGEHLAADYCFQLIMKEVHSCEPAPMLLRVAFSHHLLADRQRILESPGFFSRRLAIADRKQVERVLLDSMRHLWEPEPTECLNYRPG